MLVGEEQDLRGLRAVGAFEGPLEHRPGVGRGADGPAVAADEGLQVRCGVHVGDGHDPVDVGDLGQRLPGLLDAVDVGHVGHRAAGVQVRQDDLLVVAGQDVGRLGHEVHAAEHDVLGLGALLGQHRQPERVAPGVGPAHDLVALVVVAEDEQPVTEGSALAAAMRSASSSSVASVYHSGSGDWSRSMLSGPPRHRVARMLLKTPEIQPVGTAWSPRHGDVGLRS